MPSQASKTPPTILIYGPIGDWMGVDAREVLQQLQDLADAPELVVRIHSGGGDAMDGFAINAMLRAHKARKVVMVDGMAASAASIIAMAGDEVVMAPGSLLMLHDAWAGGVGDADALRDKAEMLDKLSSGAAAEYARKSGKSVDEMRTFMKSRAWDVGAWLSAQEAVDLGLADRVGDPVQIQARAPGARVLNSPAARFAPASERTAMSKSELLAALGLGKDAKDEQVQEKMSALQAAYQEHVEPDGDEEPKDEGEDDEEPKDEGEDDEEPKDEGEGEDDKDKPQDSAQQSVKKLEAQVAKLTALVGNLAAERETEQKRKARADRAATGVRQAGAPARDLPARPTSPTAARQERVNQMFTGVERQLSHSTARRSLRGEEV